MKSLITALVLAASSLAAWALPTTQDVETAVRQGHYAQAETMMGEVVAAKPGSARAHYVYAEVLAHNRNFAQAAQETARARQLDPAIGFTAPEKFAAFEQLLQREQAAPTGTRAAPTAAAPNPGRAVPSAPGVPGWVWPAGLALVGVALWRGLRRSRASGAAGPGALAGGAPMAAGPLAGTAPGMAPQGMATGGPGGLQPGATRGSGMLGTGLAAAGGVAGGLLLGEMLHNRGGAGSTPLDRVMPPADPSLGSDAAAELTDRPVDFGTGDDWDAGGSVDAGGDAGGGWD